MRYQIYTSCQRSLTTSSTSYTADQRHSRSATPSPNRGSHTPKNICLGIFSAENLGSWKAFPGPSSNSALGLLRRQMRKKVVGFKPFSSCTLEPGRIRQDMPLFHSRLSVHNHPGVSPAPFCGLLPVLKSIRLASNLSQNSQTSDPLHPSLFLEDLSSSGRTIGKEDPDTDGPSFNVQLSTSPAFTGTLGLILLREVEHIARRLLCTQNGLHFGKLKLSRTQEDGLRWINVLVTGCSGTFEEL